MRFTCYCSSSAVVSQRYVDAATSLGKRIAERGDELVYGGTGVGLMGVLSDAVREAGGRVTGVLPRLFVERGLIDDLADELIETEGMSGRKQAMIERADAFVALPGGFGTLEELLEVLTLKQLGYHAKPIVMLDVEGFWDRLLAFFEQLYELDFARVEYRRLYHLARDVDDLFDHVDTYEPGQLPTKWY